MSNYNYPSGRGTPQGNNYGNTYGGGGGGGGYEGKFQEQEPYPDSYNTGSYGVGGPTLAHQPPYGADSIDLSSHPSTPGHYGYGGGPTYDRYPTQASSQYDYQTSTSPPYDHYPSTAPSQYTPSSQYSSTPIQGPRSMQGYGPSNRYAEEDETFRDEGNGPTLASNQGYSGSKPTASFRTRNNIAGSPTLSEAKLLVGPNSVSKVPRKRSCVDCMLCRCWPLWARWICWIFLLALLGLIIFIVILAITFKVPKIGLNGVGPQDGVPEFQANGSSFSINFALNIGVVNDNIIGVNFQTIKAKAFYPINNTPVGGGELSGVDFPPHHTTNITFPFSIQYDPTADKDQSILNDIANKCGFLGNPKQPITVDYTLTLFVKVLFVTISPSINQHTSIDCPIKDGQLPAFAQGAASALTSSSAPQPT